MWFPFRSSRARPGAKRERPKAASARFNVEALEDRTVPSFLTAANYAGSGQFPAVGDFNNDGRPDVVSVRFDSISVLLGNAGGTFQAPRLTAASEAPLDQVKVGDFNRDGRLDVATVSDTKGIVVRLGNGNGTFQTMRSTALPRVNSTRLSPKSFAVGDLNNDGKLDVAVIAHGPASSSGGHSFGPRGSIRTTPSYAVVLIGKANGSFSVGSTTYLGSSAAPIRNIALDDFNGDGKLDALMSNAVTAHVRAGQGNGQFGDSVAVPTKNIASPVVGDFNADGKDDVATAAGGTVRVFLGNGDLTFQAAQTFALGTTLRSVTIGDFNGDGKMDLAAVDTSANSVGVALGIGDGTFQTPALFAVAPDAGGVVAGDFNGDGLTDLAVGGIDNLSVLPNDGNW